MLMLAGGGGEAELKRPNGEREKRPTSSIAEALSRAPVGSVRVRGYLDSPADDRMRLCTRLVEGACTGPSLVVVGLDVERVEGLKYGCCTIGYWSPHELALSGMVTGGVLFVPPPAG
jgi:hypothetical protein